MGQAKVISVQAVVTVERLVAQAQQLGESGEVTPAERAEVRLAGRQALAAIQFVDHRWRLIRLLTGDVRDPENIDRRCRLARVDPGLFDPDPLEAA